jgi:hypothetical protein
MTHQIKRYGTSAAERPDGIFCLYAEYEKVVAECERLRALLASPIAMGLKFSPIESSMCSGFSRTLGVDVLERSAPKAESVTVYYGETRTFKDLADFLKAHPKGQS